MMFIMRLIFINFYQALLLLSLINFTLSTKYKNSQNINLVNYKNDIESTKNLKSCENLNWGSVFSDDEIIEKILEMVPEFEVKGLEPAIPITDLHEYYKLPLSECFLEDGEFKFQVDVPAKPKNHNFELYNFPAGSFSFETESGVCFFDYPTKGIVETSSGSTIYPLTEEEFSACIETSICQIPNTSEDDENYGDYVCLKALFSGKTGRELAPYCKFHCQPHPNKSQINQNARDPRQEISDSFFFSWILK